MRYYSVLLEVTGYVTAGMWINGIRAKGNDTETRRARAAKCALLLAKRRGYPPTDYIPLVIGGY